MKKMNFVIVSPACTSRYYDVKPRFEMFEGELIRLTIDKTEVRINCVKNVTLNKRTNTVTIDLVDGPPVESREDKARVLSSMADLNW